MGWYLYSSWNQGTIPYSITVAMESSWYPTFSPSILNMRLYDGLCLSVPHMNIPINFTVHSCYPSNTTRNNMPSAVANIYIIIFRYSTRFPMIASQYQPHSQPILAAPVPAVLAPNIWVYAPGLGSYWNLGGVHITPASPAPAHAPCGPASHVAVAGLVTLATWPLPEFGGLSVKWTVPTILWVTFLI